MDIASTYESQKFWKSYNEMYWHKSSNPEIQDLVDKLIRKNENIFKTEKDTLFVLCLGSGIGTIDLPFIAKIAEQSGKKICILAVDGSSMAMKIISKCIQDENWHINLPEKHTINNFIDEISIDKYSQGLSKCGSHWLYLDTLNIELSENPLFSTFPSQWSSRLKEKMSMYPEFNEGFDMVISSLCLFHLSWWRSNTVRITLKQY